MSDGTSSISPYKGVARATESVSARREATPGHHTLRAHCDTAVADVSEEPCASCQPILCTIELEPRKTSLSQALCSWFRRDAPPRVSPSRPRPRGPPLALGLASPPRSCPSGSGSVVGPPHLAAEADSARLRRPDRGRAAARRGPDRATSSAARRRPHVPGTHSHTAHHAHAAARGPWPPRRSAESTYRQAALARFGPASEGLRASDRTDRTAAPPGTNPNFRQARSNP